MRIVLVVILGVPAGRSENACELICDLLEWEPAVWCQRSRWPQSPRWLCEGSLQGILDVTGGELLELRISNQFLFADYPLLTILAGIILPTPAIRRPAPNRVSV